MQVVIAPSTIGKVKHFRWPAYRWAIVPLLLAILVSIAVVAFKFTSLTASARWWAVSHGYNALTNEQSYLDIVKIPYYMLRPVDVPQFVVDIDFKSFQKLQKKRQQAFKRGVLVTGKNDFVPAKIRHEGKTTKVKLRLKGDRLDHLWGDKWSFRVKVKGKDHLFGMRVFSFQSPFARGLQGSPLFYATLKRYGVLAPRYKLVNVVVNGNDVGIMSVEEHFTKELLESSGRKESVIIRFDESLVWEANVGQKSAGLGGHFDNYHVAKVDGFSSNKIAKSERLSKDYEVAVGLLRAFENNLLAPSEVFDVELMARYIAISELWGSWHSFSWRNLRYYFNPITARLEPIGFDPDIQNRSSPGINRAQKGEPVTSVMRSALLDDPVIFAAFKKAVQLISADLKNGNLIKDLKKIEQEYLRILRKEFYLLQRFDSNELEQRIDLLEKYNKDDIDDLYQVKYIYPELLQAYLINNSDRSYLELANITPSLVEVLSIKWVAKTDDNKTIDVMPTDNVTFPMLLQPTPFLSNPKYRKIYVDNHSENGKDYRLEVVAKVSGAQESVRTKVVPYYSALTTNPIPQSSLQQQSIKHKEYLVTNAASARMTIKPGQWRVNESIVVPKDTVLEVSAATTLQFATNAGIISHGSLRFEGNNNNRVILEGINGADWQGVAVLNAGDISTLTHVLIRETKGMTRPGWALTGGVVFYYSDVHIKDSIFEDSRGEDALNIVHSNFTLDNVLIKNTASDAFDADFSTGSVLGGMFEDIGHAGGGDAIDVSGSKITVEGTRFININDKAVSVGEKSHILASRLDINGAGTGAASKDASILEIKLSKIHKARIAGLMAYIKKPEFGPGSITASSIDFGDGFEKARAQKESYISIDNIEVKTVDIDVDDMYRTVMKKGIELVRSEIPENARYEIKFVAYEHEYHRLLQWVKMHQAGFISPYPDRRVNNVYFDTQDCKAYAENLSGASSRRKVRYRWYGGNMRIGKGVLEVKCKRNYFGWKHHRKVSSQPDKGESSWREIRNNILAELSADGKRILLNNPNPVLINQYDRKYFVTHDGLIRLTIDRNQKVWDQRYKPKPNYVHSANLCKTIVVEIKFNRSEQSYASQIIQGIPLRVSRNSKYMVGVHTISLISHSW